MTQKPSQSEGKEFIPPCSANSQEFKTSSLISSCRKRYKNMPSSSKLMLKRLGRIKPKRKKRK